MNHCNRRRRRQSEQPERLDSMMSSSASSSTTTMESSHSVSVGCTSCARTTAIVLLIVLSTLSSTRRVEGFLNDKLTTPSLSATLSTPHNSATLLNAFFWGGDNNKSNNNNKNGNGGGKDGSKRKKLQNFLQAAMPKRLSVGAVSATTKDETDLIGTSWSRRSEQQGGSRFGVRKRVKAVLAKARCRTGVQNNSEVNGSSSSAGGSSTSSSYFMSLGSYGESDNVLKNGYYDSIIQDPMQLNSDFQMDPALAPKNGYVKPYTNFIPLIEQTSTATIVPNNNISNNKNNEKNGATSYPKLNGATAKKNGNEEPASIVEKQQIKNEIEPLPFKLPTLTDEQRRMLASGERIQEQSKMGREGRGFVVLDIKAPPFVIWECLLDFEAYPENIGTVRSMRMFTNTHLKQSYISEKPVLPGTGRETRHYGTASVTRASFVLSKFQLNIAAIHNYRPHPDGHYMVFTLDPACTNVVLQDAKGIWYTESNPDGRGEEWTRVWLLCELKCSSILPSFIVDYAAKKAMPRATTWLPQTVDKALEKFGLPPTTSSSSAAISTTNTNANGSK